jgi:hypothetical protein
MEKELKYLHIKHLLEFMNTQNFLVAALKTAIYWGIYSITTALCSLPNVAKFLVWNGEISLPINFVKKTITFAHLPQRNVNIMYTF